MAVRDVFASCYLTQGHPDRSPVSKKCERLDAVFEQNITLLPRYLRDAASLFAAPTAVLGPREEVAPSANSFTGRRQTQVQAVSTLRLVESFKQRQAAESDAQKARAARERRERLISEAEAWASESIDTPALETLRLDFDAVSLSAFVTAFATPLAIPALANAPGFSLLEFEIGLLAFPHASILLRVSVDAMLRHSTVRNGQFVPPSKTGPPSGAALAGQLAQRVDAWARQLHKVLRQEARGEEVEEWDLPYSEGYGLREIIDRLGPLANVSAALKSGGMMALSLAQRACLLHGIAEQMLDTDRDVYKRMAPTEIELARPQMLGRDSNGRWYYHFALLTSDAPEGRLYTLTSPYRPKPQPPVPHLVRVGERVEVEVEEVKGQIEWRQASVLELLAGGKGRFSVMVDGADGQPDEEFIEVFTAPLVGKEWRKLPPKEKRPKHSEPKLDQLEPNPNPNPNPNPKLDQLEPAAPVEEESAGMKWLRRTSLPADEMMAGKAGVAKGAKEVAGADVDAAAMADAAAVPSRRTRVSDVQAAKAAAAAAEAAEAAAAAEALKAARRSSKGDKGGDGSVGGGVRKKGKEPAEPEVVAPAAEDARTLERISVEQAMQSLKGSKAKVDLALLKALTALKEAGDTSEAAAKEAARKEASGHAKNSARPERGIAPWTAAIMKLHGEIQQAEEEEAAEAAAAAEAVDEAVDGAAAAEAAANPPPPPPTGARADMAADDAAIAAAMSDAGVSIGMTLPTSAEAAVSSAAGGRSARAFQRAALAAAMMESAEANGGSE